MPRFLLAWLLGLGANAIALILAAVIFDGFQLTVTGFVYALVIFAVLNAILPFIILKALMRHAGSLAALSGLFSTFLSLLVTTLLTDGLRIDGLTTWLGATVLIWVVSMVIWALPGPWRAHRKDA